VSYRDMDASAFGFPPGQTPFSEYPAQITISAEVPNIPKASISTGGAVISQQGAAGKNFKDISADMVDMESAAVLRVSNQYGVPLIGLRGISDGKEETRGYETWNRCLKEIQKGLAAVYRSIRVGLETGRLDPASLKRTPPECRDLSAEVWEDQTAAEKASYRDVRSSGGN
jgi:adenosylhomocysteine nucleosidase